MLIIGAGGHAKEVVDVYLGNEPIKEKLHLFDETISAKKIFQGDYAILNSIGEVHELFRIDNHFSLGIGSPKIRKSMIDRFEGYGGKFVEVISKNAIISEFSSIKGDVMSNVFISSNTKIGKGALINTGAQIHHDVTVGDYTEISPAAILLGKVIVNDYCLIGANSTILPGIELGINSIVGAGAVVTKNVPSNTMVAGVPARILKTID